MGLDVEPAWRVERRRKIVDAAAKLFGRAGYDEVQMDEVAELAGVAKPTIYRYFPSKDDLFLAVFNETFAALEKALSDIAAQSLPPQETLHAMIRLMLKTLGGHVALLSMLTGDHAGLAERWRKLYRQRRRVIADQFRGALEHGIELGVFQEVDVEIFGSMIVSMVRGGIIMEASIPRDRIVEGITALVLRGVEK